jgi:hypothetical protein
VNAFVPEQKGTRPARNQDREAKARLEVLRGYRR